MTTSRKERLERVMAKFSQEQLELLAKKFGRIPSSVKNTKDGIVGGGYLAEEEFEALIACPRSQEMKSATSWGKIGGRNIYPLSGILTEEESQMYYSYKKGLKTGTPRNVSSSTDLGAFKMFLGLALQSKNEEAIDSLLKMYPVYAKFGALLKLQMQNPSTELAAAIEAAMV